MMKIRRSITPFCLPLLAGILAFCLQCLPASAAATFTSLVESRLGGTILSSPADKLVSTVRECVKADPHRAAGIVHAVLSGGRADSDALAPGVAASAIEGLGGKATSASVGEIVYTAVKATPAVVLDIVRAAVKAAPKDTAQAIVKAAVKALPNPQDTAASPAGSKQTGYAKDFKNAGDDADELLPIGEAIAQAAQQADPTLSLAELLSTANQGVAESLAATSNRVDNIYHGYYYPPFDPRLPLIHTASSTLPSPPVVSK